MGKNMGKNRPLHKHKNEARRGRNRFLRKQERIAYLFLAPSLIGVSIFVLLPFCDAVRRSFYEAMSGKYVGFDNYITVFKNEAFQMAARNTLRFTFTCIPILLVISLLFAVIISGFKKTGDFFKATFLVPMAIPVASIVLLWNVFFHQNGLINVILIHFGGKGIDFMNTDKAFYVLVFTYVWKNVGYDMVLWLAGLSGISDSYYEAAKVDGAGAFAIFRYITLPSLRPTIYITAVLSLVNSFKAFREAYLIAGSYPHESIYMMQHLFNNWFVALDIQKMCAAAVVMAIVVIILVLLLQRIGGRDENA
ncbi:MAG TPA: sugar ABC transporter permease [Lachnospiraceae bacterium]|nr:sugar ABC transporter permease [Lachnospiraceae bacterium]